VLAPKRCIVRPTLARQAFEFYIVRARRDSRLAGTRSALPTKTNENRRAVSGIASAIVLNLLQSEAAA
jgi:hypothetical protein